MAERAVLVCVLATLGGIAAAVVAAFLIVVRPGKTYVFVIDAKVEHVEAYITHPAVSRVALLNASQVLPAVDGCLTGEVMPSERTRVALERRGSGPMKLVLRGYQDSSSGHTELREGSGASEVEPVDLPSEAGFRVFPSGGDASTVVPPREKKRCLEAGTIRAALEGPLEVGEELSAAVQSAARLSPGDSAPPTITLRMIGRSVLGVAYELSAITLPPHSRLSPGETSAPSPRTSRRAASDEQYDAGVTDVWSTTVTPADTGLDVQATTTARELRVYSATSPAQGDVIRARFFSVLFNDPDMSAVAALAAFFAAISQVVDLLRGWLERRTVSGAA